MECRAGHNLQPPSPCGYLPEQGWISNIQATSTIVNMFLETDVVSVHVMYILHEYFDAPDQLIVLHINEKLTIRKLKLSLNYCIKMTIIYCNTNIQV